MNIRNYLSLLIFCILQFSTTPTAIAQSYPFRNYSIEDGLVQSTVTAILQDSHGFLWFGTEAGISKFDGIAFVNYSAENGFCNDAVYSIIEDRNKNIWISTQGSGVFCLKGGKFANDRLACKRRNRRSQNFRH